MEGEEKYENRILSYGARLDCHAVSHSGDVEERMR